MRDTKLEKAVVKYKEGDKDSFDTIYDLTYKLVFFVAYEVVNDKTIAEDIVQDTYVKVFENINRYNSNSFTAWICTIAKNLAINYQNKRKRENTYDDIESLNLGSSNDFAENYGVIDIARKILSEEDYNIVIMCVISGYKRREVSKILNIPVSTVSYRLKTALNLLKEELKKR